MDPPPLFLRGAKANMLKPMQKARPIDRDAAETLAAQGLAFLAEDPQQLVRFLALTGLEPTDLRARAGAPEVLAAVLSYLREDESLLLTFATRCKVAPETIGRALSLLQGTDGG
jgi:hypothetical protein